MTLPDYLIIAAVAALFVLAFTEYRKKPHCSFGKSGGCSGNCAGCCFKCEADDEYKTCKQR